MEIIFMSENWVDTGDKMLLSSVTEKSWKFGFIKPVDKGRISTVRHLFCALVIFQILVFIWIECVNS